MTTKTNSQTKVNPIKVIIVEDYKLTRVGLRYALNEFEHINVIGEAESGEAGLEFIKKEKNFINCYFILNQKQQKLL